MRKLTIRVLLSILIGLLPACRYVSSLDPDVTATPQKFSQWAIAAEASSSFGMPDWSVTRATGAPDVNMCADDSRAWASGRGNGVEWLQLTYAKPVHALEVHVYQTFGRGAISRISIFDAEGNREIVWEGEDDTDPCPGVLAVSFPETAYRVKQVRIDLDESRTGFWNEIDAVALIGVQ
ncbi:MAG: hypothetical protein JXA33_19335 [Anaerolineae bacterium]|nr:hypothetical protein [Anaerolineae bacterium]